MVAREDATASPDLVVRPATHIDHGHLPRVLGGAAVADLDGRAVEPDPDRGIRLIEPRIVEARRDDVLHGVPLRHARDEGAHQETGDRGIAVRKMKNVGLPAPLLPRLSPPPGKAHPLKTRKAQRLEGRDRIDADARLTMGPLLEVGDHLGIDPSVVSEEVGIADPLQPGPLLVRRKARQVIHRLLVEAEEIVPSFLGEGRLGGERSPTGLLVPVPLASLVLDHQAINAEGLPVEEDALTETERVVEIPIECLVELLDVDADSTRSALATAL